MLKSASIRIGGALGRIVKGVGDVKTRRLLHRVRTEQELPGTGTLSDSVNGDLSAGNSPTRQLLEIFLHVFPDIGIGDFGKVRQLHTADNFPEQVEGFVGDLALGGWWYPA